jgi:hypothetical protein
MRVPLLTIITVAIAAAAEAQQPGAESGERVRAAQQISVSTLQIPPFRILPDPAIRRFGVVTLLPPDTSGQFVRASVPVGDLAMRAARAVAIAQHRRAEKVAREEVRQTLQRSWLANRSSQLAETARLRQGYGGQPSRER